MERSHKECGQPLAAKTQPQEAASEGTGTQSYSHNELNSANNPNGLRSIGCPGASRREPSPAATRGALQLETQVGTACSPLAPRTVQ